MEPDHWKREKINFWLLFLKYGASTFSLLYILTNGMIKVKISRKWKRIFAHRAVLRMRKRNFRSRSFVSCWGPSHVLRVRKSVRRWVGGVSWVWQLPSQSDSDYIRKLFVMHEGTERSRSFFACCFLSCCCFRWNFGVRETQNTISKVSTAALIMIKCKI